MPFACSSTCCVYCRSVTLAHAYAKIVFTVLPINAVRFCACAEKEIARVEDELVKLQAEMDEMEEQAFKVPHKS